MLLLLHSLYYSSKGKGKCKVRVAGSCIALHYIRSYLKWPM